MLQDEENALYFQEILQVKVKIRTKIKVVIYFLILNVCGEYIYGLLGLETEQCQGNRMGLRKKTLYEVIFRFQLIIDPNIHKHLPIKSLMLY